MPKKDRQKLKMNHVTTLILSACLFAPSGLFGSSLYTYQDENGQWHFTDRPLDTQYHKRPTQNMTTNQGLTTHRQKKKEKKHKRVTHNLAQTLQEQIQPKNTIEIATMAVVGIETHFGSGSGFFITSEGHIITNRHVLRAKKYFKDTEKEFADTQQQLKQWKDNIDQRNKELKNHANELKEFAMQNGLNYKTPKNLHLKQKIENLKKQKNLYKKDYKKYTNNASEWKKANSEFKWKQSMAGIAKTFTIVLKNKTQLKAKLVHISESEDLALLKIDGYQTPYLPIGSLRTMAQGNQVFAIGSPLGQRDSVSAGILTSMSHTTIITDSQILPGNSGGPLITPDGKVIAINTARVSEIRGGAGFGHSIPIDIAIQHLKKLYESSGF